MADLLALSPVWAWALSDHRQTTGRSMTSSSTGHSGEAVTRNTTTQHRLVFSANQLYDVLINYAQPDFSCAVIEHTTPYWKSEKCSTSTINSVCRLPKLGNNSTLPCPQRVLHKLQRDVLCPHLETPRNKCRREWYVRRGYRLSNWNNRTLTLQHNVGQCMHACVRALVLILTARMR